VVYLSTINNGTGGLQGDKSPQNVSESTLLPLHPGAIRYRREVGIQVPPKLVRSN
jgi:TRAP-type uncharacterized transport system substrate-binding protein